MIVFVSFVLLSLKKYFQNVSSALYHGAEKPVNVIAEGMFKSLISQEGRYLILQELFRYSGYLLIIVISAIISKKNDLFLFILSGLYIITIRAMLTFSLFGRDLFDLVYWGETLPLAFFAISSSIAMSRVFSMKTGKYIVLLMSMVYTFFWGYMQLDHQKNFINLFISADESVYLNKKQNIQLIESFTSNKEIPAGISSVAPPTYQRYSINKYSHIDTNLFCKWLKEGRVGLEDIVYVLFESKNSDQRCMQIIEKEFKKEDLNLFADNVLYVNENIIKRKK
jgi:hypothetical protein